MPYGIPLYHPGVSMQRCREGIDWRQKQGRSSRKQGSRVMYFTVNTPQGVELVILCRISDPPGGSLLDGRGR
jgi:hypothetical protein